jgi:divalent metal cation (Fe/Co/Zn/Cd) transporter
VNVSSTRVGAGGEEVAVATREELVARGIRLSYATIAYNSLEAIASLIAGLLAGSVALVGFGIDSLIEVSASGAAQWRLRSDLDVARRSRSETVTHRFVGACFLALAAYVLVDSAKTLWFRERPDGTIAGIVILSMSVVVMPLLARAKLKVASAMQSGALRAEARQTSLCAYLSIIALVGVFLNATLGWWWADPVAALCMVPIIMSEGIGGLLAKPCDDCSGILVEL